MVAKRRIVSVFLALLLAAALLPFTANTAHAEEAGWVDIGGFKVWIDPRDGTAIICGRAEGNTATELSIPATVEYAGRTFTVTDIDGCAFSNDTLLTKVTIAKGIKKIGNSAFSGCANLSAIDLPDDLDEIGDHVLSGTAFYENRENWDDGVLYIENYLIEAKRDISGKSAEDQSLEKEPISNQS